MKFRIEYTDTFAGEANYAWVRRAKKALGLSGVRGRRESWGETVIFRPYGSCTILFIMPEY